MNELMSTIKEHMIPLIVEQLKTVELPAINEEISALLASFLFRLTILPPAASDSGTTKLSFSVSNISLNEIEVPADSVVCNLVPGSGIRVQLSGATFFRSESAAMSHAPRFSDISARIPKFDWSYKKETYVWSDLSAFFSFPHLRSADSLS